VKNWAVPAMSITMAAKKVRPTAHLPILSSVPADRFRTGGCSVMLPSFLPFPPR
jgi:hypothetical protein